MHLAQIGNSSQLFWTWWWTFRFHKRWGIWLPSDYQLFKKESALWS